MNPPLPSLRRTTRLYRGPRNSGGFGYGNLRGDGLPAGPRGENPTALGRVRGQEAPEGTNVAARQVR